jgi:hypothetical protein|tara:strand:- start:5146 stop:5286 length:141 start_codon:yes stop_codon:yes gene_type:complete
MTSLEPAPAPTVLAAVRAGQPGDLETPAFAQLLHSTSRVISANYLF